MFRAMAYIKKESGFTLIEILVAMGILVLAFALVTVLYTRASKIRKVITVQNDIQNVLTQMINTITHQNTLNNLENAVSVYQYSPTETKDKDYYLVYGSPFSSGQPYQWYRIAPDVSSGDTTLWYGQSSSITEPTDWTCLDVNRVITLESDSKFEYFDSGNTLMSDKVYPETTTLVKITLKGKSTDPSMKNSPPVILQTAIRLRNKPAF